MPFKSKKQARYLYANHPEVAKKFAAKTKNMKRLPKGAGVSRTKRARRSI